MLLFLACDFSAATKIVDDSAVDTEVSESGVDTYDSQVETGETTDVNPYEVDDDGDGLSENEGDCDDGNAGIHPGAADSCDGIDNDCDQSVDEDGEIGRAHV